MRLAILAPSLALALSASACASAPASPPAPPSPPPAPSVPAPTASAPPPAPAEAPPSRLDALAPTWDARRLAAHALERLAYGPRPGDVAAIGSSGVEAWILRQMHPTTISDASLEAKLAALPSLSMTPAELHARYPRPMQAAKLAAAMPQTPGQQGAPAPADHKPAEIERELAAAKMVRAVDSGRQLQEVMVDFWFNHFNVFADKGADRWLVGPYERDAIRPHVFGRFRDLLGAVAHHPAMLFYLDNWLSVADSAVKGPPPAGAPPVKNKGSSGLNENYGRELLELHTLGVDGGYSQDDVREAARAFTGWSIEKPNLVGVFAFHPRKHDGAAKTVLGHAIAAGGEADGEAVLDLVATHPATAKLVARKLCTKLVADDPPADCVDRAAEAFTKSGGDLTATYEAIVFGPSMWSDAAERSKTKTPLEVVASAVRAVGGTVDVENDLPKSVARMGQPLYRMAPPTGYKETGDAWVSTGALVTRIDFGIALAAGRVRGVTFDREKLVGGAPPEDPASLVDRLAVAVLARPISQATHDTVTAELRQSMHGVTYQEPQPDQVPRALGLLLGCPEFQKQ